jgi:predicted O-methyltransferase YrrM
VAIARLLAERGSGRIWSLEHDRGWAAETRARLECEGLTDFAELVEAPLRLHATAGPAGWYDATALAHLPRAIDLLLVDGPPADLATDGQTRYPALPLLAPLLAPGAVVILDDIHRAGELAVLERWRREFAVEFELDPGARLAIGVFSDAQVLAETALERGT